MGNTYCVGKVVIFNREDSCCKERLTDAVIGIGGDKTNYTICGTVNSSMIEQSAKLEVMCAIRGRYISIHLPTSVTGNTVLTLCEVQAFECGGNGKTLITKLTRCWLVNWKRKNNQSINP